MNEEFVKIQEIVELLEISNEQLLVLKDHMLSEIKRGLQIETHETASIKCWPTYVQDFPNGCERGMFLVAHLSSFHIRISMFYLKGECGHSVVKEQFEISEKLLASENIEIFDYMAQCLQKFVKKNEIHRDPLELAVKFTFPLEHEDLTNATPTPFAKNCIFVNDKEKDTGKAISKALKRLNLRIQLVALLSDATGILLACYLRHPACKIGIIVGTEETNVSYTEKIENMDICQKKSYQPNMNVNLDCGSVGEKGALENVRNDIDRQVDTNSPNVGHRLFEKMISAHYAAELARCIFVVCANKGILFGGETGKLLKTPFSFKTANMVEVLAHDIKTFDDTLPMFDKLGISRPNLQECAKLRYILECVIRRSATLMATGIACLLEKLEDKHIEIGIDGSFYRNSQVYHAFLEKSLHQQLGGKTSFNLIFTEDDSDKGAAILAATTLQKQFIFQVKQNAEEERD